MCGWWDKQIQRADQLAVSANGSAALVAFYAHLLRAQKNVYDFLRSRQNWLPTGELERDLTIVGDAFPGFVEVIAFRAPEALADDARKLLGAAREQTNDLLVNYWHDPMDTDFFGKAFLQPYTNWLVAMRVQPSGRALAEHERSCPFCGGNPQVSFLQSKESNAESGNRELICALCLSGWEFRRVVCANCGEERPAKLAYFQSPAFEHIRIEACDTCKHYIKGVDLTRLGFAAPLVDEIASAPLDLWAREHGYTKIELNLVGV
jgi:Protein involved in formate dehydrogenase formation